MFENLNQKQKIIFIIILIFMIGVIVYYIYSTLSNYNEETFANNSEEELLMNSQDEEELQNNNFEDNKILIHISGCVKNNTVVSLPEGSRINDAIEAAGGLTNDADLTNINLAYILEDGEKIYIPKKGEEFAEESYSSAVSSETSSVKTGMSSSTISSSKPTKININKATQTALETIPGIGPSTALKIIDYREENGKFNSIEDIKNVSGIGDAKYEKMKDYITVK